MTPPDVATEETIELFSFKIADQEFCIDIRSVREIRGWTPATRIPNSPPYVLGVINLRGSVMPVLDLRYRLGLGETTASSRHVFVVVQDGDRVAGLMVDAVQETFVVDGALLQAPPELGGGDEARFVDAIIPLEGRMLSRLVVSALLPRRTQIAA